MSILTILRVSVLGKGRSATAIPEPGLPGLLENWVSHAVEMMARRLSDLHTWSEVLEAGAGRGAGEELVLVEVRVTGWRSRDFLAGVLGSCTGSGLSGGGWWPGEPG